MAKEYYQVIEGAFKEFSMKRAVHTGLPTLWHYLRRKPLPPSEKPALFTMNILPPMMTVWHHITRKALGDSVDIVIFDCSGALQAKQFPGARVQKFLNFYAATKSDEFIYHIAKHRKLAWICDDDMFITSNKALEYLNHAFADPNTASLSYLPRKWWEFDIDGERYMPSSSYCTAINREIFVEKEQLSCKPARGNDHPAVGENKAPGRYDTFDLANETLIKKGYNCAIVNDSDREGVVTGFKGLSAAVMLLWHFNKPEDVESLLLTPPKKQWTGNILYRALGGLLAIDAIQDLYEEITGERYNLPSMPSKAALSHIRAEHEPLLERGRSFTDIDITAEKLKAVL